MSVVSVEVQGTVAPGFERVAEVFASNFVEHGEVGAACAVRVGGEEVVDIWAGVADPATGRPYDGDTLQLVFSATKGIVAAAAHVLIERGLLDPDEPVARYWPEFAANGKGHIPVRWVLAHRSGVVGIDRVLSVDEFTSWDPFVEALAAAEPLWEPDTAHGYHALSFGFLVGELVRRITGTDIGTFVREEVAGPVGAEFLIGLDDEALTRVAPLLGPVAKPGEVASAVMVALLTGGTPTNRAFMIAPVLPTSFNQPEILRAQIPSANGCTSARSLARIYGALVSEVDGVRLIGPERVEDLRRVQSQGDDLVLVGDPNAIGSGFFLPDPGESDARSRVVRPLRHGRLARHRAAGARDRLRVRDEPDVAAHQGRPTDPQAAGGGARLHRLKRRSSPAGRPGTVGGNEHAGELEESG